MHTTKTEESAKKGWREILQDMDTCPSVAEFLTYLGQLARLGDLETKHPPLLRFGWNEFMFYVQVIGMPVISKGTFSLQCEVMEVKGPNRKPIHAKQFILIEGYCPVRRATQRVLLRDK